MLKIMGQAVATVQQLQTYIKKVNPKVPDSVTKMIPLYISEGAIEGVRGDIAFAQSCLETGNFTFSGSSVTLDQNNFCGLGTIGGGVRGASFATPELGVRAHIQHLLAYTQRKEPATEIVDPRYDVAHRIRMERGIVDTWYGLNGTWAMGSLYCEKIMATYQKIMAMQVVEPAAQPEKKKEKQEKKSMKQRVREILH